MVRKGMPATRAKGVRLPGKLWDEIEDAAAERGVSANAELARRVESAPSRRAMPGSRVRVQADRSTPASPPRSRWRAAGLGRAGRRRRPRAAIGSVSWRHRTTATRARPDGRRTGTRDGDDDRLYVSPRRTTAGAEVLSGEICERYGEGCEHGAPRMERHSTRAR